MSRPSYLVALGLTLILLSAGLSFAQQAKKAGGRTIMCMIQLEHADAEHLASILKPFLSTEGRIVPYRPTNTLIIEDRASRVEQLSIAIKGTPCIPEPASKMLLTPKGK